MDAPTLDFQRQIIRAARGMLAAWDKWLDAKADGHALPTNGGMTTPTSR